MDEHNERGNQPPLQEQSKEQEFSGWGLLLRSIVAIPLFAMGLLLLHFGGKVGAIANIPGSVCFILAVVTLFAPSKVAATTGIVGLLLLIILVVLLGMVLRAVHSV